MTQPHPTPSPAPPPSATPSPAPPPSATPSPAPPPTYDRGPAEQQAFAEAVARLQANDSWYNPVTRRRELNADLVLEGGGVKGIGLVGAILVLAEAGYQLPRVAGTSAGAIVAVLAAAVQKSGKPMTVLGDYLKEIDYSQFMHTGLVQQIFDRFGGRVADAFELMFHEGLYNGDYLNTWLGGKLRDCGVVSWADLAIAPEDDPGTDLPSDQRYRAVVHVSDITRRTLARLPWDYANYYGLPAGAQEVVAAVRASMSIPFFFVPVRTITRPVVTKMPDGSELSWPGGSVTWVDGGMLMNFPIDAFDRTDGLPPRWPTIGIKLSAEPGPQPVDVPATSTLDEAISCLKTMTGEWDRYYVEEATAQRTIFVPNAGITATDFNLTPAQQDELFLNGARAATEFVIRWAGYGGLLHGTPPATVAA
jgi:NTE family protein